MEKKEDEEGTKKSGQPAGRNELEVNQTYRSYRSTATTTTYLHQLYIVV